MMMDDDNDDLGGLKLPDICLTGEEKPRKSSPRKLVPTGDRTQACCVTGVHATAWPTAVDALKTFKIIHYTKCKKSMWQGLVVGRWVSCDHILLIKLRYKRFVHVLAHGCARVAHCVTARWRKFSHYCRPLRHYDVWFACSDNREALQPRRQQTVYTN